MFFWNAKQDYLTSAGTPPTQNGRNLSGGGRLIMIYDVTINKNVYNIGYKWHLFGVPFVREDEPKKKNWSPGNMIAYPNNNEISSLMNWIFSVQWKSRTIGIYDNISPWNQGFNICYLDCRNTFRTVRPLDVVCNGEYTMNIGWNFAH